MTNKVFIVILFAYVEGLATSLKESRERPPVSLLFSDLMAKFSNASPDRFLARSSTVEQWHWQQCKQQVVLMTLTVL